MLEKVITHTDRGRESERQCSSRQGGGSVNVCVCAQAREHEWDREQGDWYREGQRQWKEKQLVENVRACVLKRASILFLGHNNHGLWPSVSHVFCTFYNALSTCWPPSEHCEKCFIREDSCQPLAQPLQSSKALLITANTSVCAIAASNPNPVTWLYSRHTCYLPSQLRFWTGSGAQMIKHSLLKAVIHVLGLCHCFGLLEASLVVLYCFSSGRNLIVNSPFFHVVCQKIKPWGQMINQQPQALQPFIFLVFTCSGLVDDGDNGFPQAP